MWQNFRILISFTNYNQWTDARFFVSRILYYLVVLSVFMWKYLLVEYVCGLRQQWFMSLSFQVSVVIVVFLEWQFFPKSTPCISIRVLNIDRFVLCRYATVESWMYCRNNSNYFCESPSDYNFLKLCLR